MQKALPLLRDGGSIIMTGLIAGSKGFPGFSVYNASKAAIRSLARTWTLDLQSRKIRVNIISPGPIATAAMDGMPKEMIDGFISGVPMQRIGKSEEVAAAALFLASEDSSYTTGAEIFVDGGAAQV